jgi:hypothetical protein
MAFGILNDQNLYEHDGNPPKPKLRTTATGTFTFSGLKNGGKITEVTLNDATWTPLPAAALANRNAIAIQNDSGQDIKINYDNAVVGFIGVKIPNGGERQYDITDGIIQYGKCASGTCNIVIEELS